MEIFFFIYIYKTITAWKPYYIYLLSDSIWFTLLYIVTKCLCFWSLLLNSKKKNFFFMMVCLFIYIYLSTYTKSSYCFLGIHLSSNTPRPASPRPASPRRQRGSLQSNVCSSQPKHCFKINGLVNYHIIIMPLHTLFYIKYVVILSLAEKI